MAKGVERVVRGSRRGSSSSHELAASAKRETSLHLCLMGLELKPDKGIKDFKFQMRAPVSCPSHSNKVSSHKPCGNCLTTFGAKFACKAGRHRHTHTNQIRQLARRTQTERQTDYPSAPSFTFGKYMRRVEVQVGDKSKT